MGNNTKTIPERNEVPTNDTWDLSDLFTNDQEWESGLSLYKKRTPDIEKFRGVLGRGVVGDGQDLPGRRRHRGPGDVGAGRAPVATAYFG